MRALSFQESPRSFESATVRMSQESIRTHRRSSHL
nr:MAG TPA: hypothetical protein [Bacteriophage sp.]DAV22790.1 MAG TPA: hypothetical protein [Caudoviricetes sp.]